MKKSLLFLCVFIVGFGLVGVAGAYQWVDVYNPADIYFSSPYKLPIAGVQNHSYSHDITDNGFDPLEDWVFYYDLSLLFYDDWEGWWEPGDPPKEWVSIDLPGIFADQVVEIDFENVSIGMSLLG